MRFKYFYENENSDYRGSHKIAYDEEYNSPLYDLTKGDGSPKDIYTNIRDYMFRRDNCDAESVKVIQSVKGKPNEIVTVYRGVPSDVNTINSGDWVSLSNSYAEQHIRGDENAHVISKKVPVKNVIWDGNDINEFVYFSNIKEVYEENEDVFMDSVYQGIKKYDVLTTTIDGDLYLQLYHGTSKKNLMKIVKDRSLNPNTYFAADIDTAKRYAQMTWGTPVVDTMYVKADGLVFDGNYFYTRRKMDFNNGVYK